MRGYTVKSPENVALARELREQGLTLREIGERIGVATSTVYAWTDPNATPALRPTTCANCGTAIPQPDGPGRSRKWCSRRCRRTLYEGECRDCGAATNGSNGAEAAPTRCLPCSRRYTHEQSRRRIITAIHEWADEHGGVPPSATRWNPSQAEANGRDDWALEFRQANGRWPSATTVQQVFGSWRAAIEAAGFECHLPGRPQREERAA